MKVPLNCNQGMSHESTPCNQGMSHESTPCHQGMSHESTPCHQGMSHESTPCNQGMSHESTPCNQGMSHESTPCNQGMSHESTPCNQGTSHECTPCNQGMSHESTPCNQGTSHECTPCNQGMSHNSACYLVLCQESAKVTLLPKTATLNGVSGIISFAYPPATFGVDMSSLLNKVLHRVNPATLSSLVQGSRLQERNKATNTQAAFCRESPDEKYSLLQCGDFGYHAIRMFSIIKMP